MTIYAPDYPSQWKPLANDAEDSAFRGNPMTMFYEGGRVGTKPIAIRVPRDPARYAKGGLAAEAQRVRDAGVGGDELIIHINRKEFEELKKHWGEPTINPHTGMPQFTPFWKQSWFAPVAALAGAALMATGIGAPLGAALLPASLAGETILGAALPSVAGNALIGAGIGGITGGGKGAALGALTGGLGTVAAGALGSTLPGVTSSGAEGLSGWMGRMGSGEFLSQGLIPSSAATGNIPMPTARPTGAELAAIGGTERAAAAAAPAAAQTGLGGILSSLGGAKTVVPAALLAASAFGGGAPAQPQAPTQTAPIDPNMTRRLEITPLTRTRRSTPNSYYSYGSMPENVYYNEPTVQAATGGPLSRFVQGGGTGRSDSIDAKLSDGEYVLDATTVSLLGDGSSKAGAAKLDRMRKNIWKQKGKGMVKGNFGVDAKDPEEYLS